MLTLYNLDYFEGQSVQRRMSFKMSFKVSHKKRSQGEAVCDFSFCD